MDFIVAVGFLVACIWVWRVVALRLGRKNNGWLVRHFVGSSAGFFAGFCVFTFAIALGIISPEKKDTAPVEASTNSATVMDKEPGTSELTEGVVAQEKTLGVTPEIYADRLNTIFKGAKLKHRVGTKVVTQGAVNDSLLIEVSQFTSLVISVSKVNGEMLGLTIIGAGDGTPSSGVDIMLVASAALNAAVPALEFKDLFADLPGLLKGQARVHGDIKLSASKIDQMGTFFFAEPA